MSASALSAEYSAPGSKIDMSVPLSTPSNKDMTTAEAKTSHLAELRTRTSELQNNVNAFLTAKMAEDAQSTESTTQQNRDKSQADRDQQAAEDYYGEEIVDAD